MAFDRFYITNIGTQYLAMLQAGSKLVITKAQIGTGFLPAGQTAVGRTALVSYLTDCPIASKQASGNKLSVTMNFVNRNSAGAIMDPFWWAEVGLFAKLDNDPDHPEILFAYANAMSEAYADYIPGTLTDFQFVMQLNIQNASTSASVQITESVLYASKVSGAVAGNFASLASDGSYADSGKGPSDFAAVAHTHNYAGSSSAGGAANNSLALGGQNADQYATLSGSQALTNKTINGYTLGAACAKAVDTSPASGSTNLLTSGGAYVALAGKAASAHAHVQGDITGLAGALAAKASVVASSTAGNFAGLDVSGNLTDSGKKAADFAAAAHAHAQGDVTGLASALAGKASIVASPTAGNFAGLSAGGDLLDSGKKASDFAAAAHSHPYAGSSSAGGDATNALSLGGVVASSYVTLTGTQALTNKTINGYTLGAASARAVDTAPASGSTNLLTSGGAFTALAGKAAASHAHTQSEVTGLSDALAAKAASSHSHAQSDVSGLADSLAAKAAASHSHAQADITGLAAALSGKASLVGSAVTGNFAGLDSNGNPTDSGKKAVDFAAASHNHLYAGSNYTGGDAINALSLGGVAASNYATLTATQALTNKTINGFTPGAACARAVDTAPASESVALLTSGGAFTALAGKAAASHTHAPTDISNVVPINKGGTNADNAKGALNSLGIFFSATLPSTGTDGQICLVPVS